MQVTFRFRSLGELLAKRGDELPNELLELILLELSEKHSGGIVGKIASELQEQEGETKKQRAEKEQRARELGEGAARLVRELVAFSLVEPRVSADDLASDDMPVQDLELLAGILNRQVLFDAVGRRMGVERLSDYAPFCPEHAGAADCEACAAERAAHSSLVHLGAL
jgi:hypothetical protein